MHPTVTSVLYIHSVHKHRGNTFQRQNYKMRLKQRSLNCLGNTIDGNIFNKHNDQEKKTLVKRIFFTCMEFMKMKVDSFNIVLEKPNTKSY
jgi:hypothetical protein